MTPWTGANFQSHFIVELSGVTYAVKSAPVHFHIRKPSMFFVGKSAPGVAAGLPNAARSRFWLHGYHSAVTHRVMNEDCKSRKWLLEILQVCLVLPMQVYVTLWGNSNKYPLTVTSVMTLVVSCVFIGKNIRKRLKLLQLNKEARTIWLRAARDPTVSLVHQALCWRDLHNFCGSTIPEDVRQTAPIALPTPRPWWAQLI